VTCELQLHVPVFPKCSRWKILLRARIFFSEIIASISDVKFSQDGRYLLARDYLSIKVWDVRYESAPLKTLPVHESLRQRLCDLYENDSIFDRFECSFTADTSVIVTGSYKNQFKVFDSHSFLSAGSSSLPPATVDEVRSAAASATVPTPLTIEAVKVQQRPKKKNPLTSLARNRFGGRKKTPPNSGGDTVEVYERADFTKRVIHLAAHPEESEVAVAALGSCFVFGAVPSGNEA